jgi:signal transduction histidine kinase/CheY-like chemotaxis protein
MWSPHGGGACGALIRAFDWSNTPVGALASWPICLRTVVQMLLHSRHPMFLWWGPELIQFYNDAYMPSFGHGKHPTAIGQRGEDCWGEIWPIIGPQIAGVMQRGEPTWHEDALVPIFRNGRIEEVYWTYGYSPVFDEQGRVAGTLVVCTETTARVLAARHLEAASQAKDDFLALLGHELRNPIAPIASALDLIRARTPALSHEHEIIERHVTHLTRLVDDLLDVSRVACGKLELRREAVAIGDVIAKATEMAGPLVERRGHRLVVEQPREPIAWFGDPMRLAQVVSNLLTNAARYTDPGGEIRLTVARVAAPAPSIEISVTDNGSGIPPELMPRIFDRFVQGQGVPERSHGGLGIGLMLVKSLVELHGGKVAAHSDGLGRGSRFVVALPLEGEAADAARAAAAGRRAATGDGLRRVLVVDDNIDAADLLADLLRMKGHEVEVAYDARSALAAMPAFRPHVAIFDIGLPDIDGYELAHQVAAGDHGGCRLIAVTGYGQERDALRARDAGFHAHLVKPVKLETLLDAVAEA